MTEMAADKKRKWRRINGLSLPLDSFQITAWTFTVLLSLIYFGAIVQSFPYPFGVCQLVLIILMSILLFVHIILHIACVIVDPADLAVRAKKQENPLPEFNRRKHLRVIENQFCNICEVKVGSKSKHCSACNKCIDGFDHHCKWLNNCVGKRNYKLFLSCICSALNCIILVLVASIICFIEAVNKTSQTSLQHYENISSNSTWHSQDLRNSSVVNLHYIIFVPVKKIPWLTVVVATIVLTVVAFGLLVHLLGFHLILICKGFSTYEYIMRHRESDNEQNPRSLAASVAKKCSLSQNNKRISPHKPTSVENSSHSLRPNKILNMSKLNGDTQTKKEPLSVSKEGLCSSGDVYIGSPANTLRNNSIRSATYTQTPHQNEGFVVDFKPQLNNVTKVSVKPKDHNEDNDEEETAFCDNDDPPLKHEPQPLKSRSPSLNNLMINEDSGEMSGQCVVFDDIERCKDSNADDGKLLEDESKHVPKEENFLNHCELSRNNNIESDNFAELPYQYQGEFSKVPLDNPAAQAQYGRSLSVDNYEFSRTRDSPNLINKRRCSVEIHNLSAGTNAQTSLTPLDANSIPENKKSSREQRWQQSNQSLAQTMHNNIV